MSINCQNCNAKLSCGCQKRVASNGASVCSTCLASYEAALKKAKANQYPPQPGGNAPSNVTVLYKGPGQTH